MDITFKTRHFYPDELRLLKTLKTQKEKQRVSKIKFYHYVIAGLLGASCTYIAATIPDSFWTFLFGTIAVFSFGFIVFTPNEIYKQKKDIRISCNNLMLLLTRGQLILALFIQKELL
jgi:hypothetical protein